MTAAPNRTVEWGFIALMFGGLIFETLGLLVDYAHLFGGPNFYLALDLEIAGLVLILFGFIGDILYSHI